MRFTRKRTGIEARLNRVEAAMLSSMASDLLELLDHDVDAAEQDPLAALVGMPTGPVKRPSDPALVRLLPDAYTDDQDAADFRRYTESDLRAAKRATAAVMLASLGSVPAGGRVPLEPGQADAWLGCLNDLRLILGSRMEVSEETDLYPEPDDPKFQGLEIYGWLGRLQESLLAHMQAGAR